LRSQHLRGQFTPADVFTSSHLCTCVPVYRRDIVFVELDAVRSLILAHPLTTTRIDNLPRSQLFAVVGVSVKGLLVFRAATRRALKTRCQTPSQIRRHACPLRAPRRRPTPSDCKKVNCNERKNKRFSAVTILAFTSPRCCYRLSVLVEN